MIRAAGLLLLLAAPAAAIPDNIWDHIETACSAGQVPIKNATNDWTCGAPVAGSVGSGGVDFSTITLALATKLSSTTAIPPALVNLSTITTALALKHGLAISSSEIDFSTITTALATKASTGTDNSMTTANALTTLGAAVVAVTTITASGQINAGFERVVNACGAGVTSCTATCSAGRVALGGSCHPAVGTPSAETLGVASFLCETALATDLTTTVACARFGP